MKIGFIGAGKVGFTLGKYLIENDISVSGFFSKSEESSLDASNFTNTKNYKYINDLIEESDILIITTPDDQIINVWNQIKRLYIKGKFICHCSGSLSSKIFSNISNYGAYAYSIHPMFPISDKYNSYKNIKDAFITIEGDIKYIKEVQEFINNLGNKTKIINSTDKTKYHLASVISSNLVIGLLSMSTKYLNECGFELNEAIESLYPLVESNIKNIYRNGLASSLTGPIERADVNTVNNHYTSLNDYDKDVYTILSKNILSIAKEKNKDRNYSKMQKILEREDKSYEKYSSNV